MPKLIILFALLFSSVSFADNQLNFDLTQAAAKDDLKSVTELLAKGADPLAYARWGGWSIDPALHQAALSAAKFGKDEVYREFIKRGLRPNALGVFPEKGTTGESVWEYVLVAMPEVSFAQKTEEFLLRSLKEGANPFENGVYSFLFSDLIIRKFDRLVAEIIQLGVARESWLVFTTAWTGNYEYNNSDPKSRQDLLQIFRKYYPIVQAANISISQWGKYRFKDNQITSFTPSAFSFVDYPGHNVDEEFLAEFAKQTFDLNKKFAGFSTCDRAEGSTFEAVKILLKLGCAKPASWILNALYKENFALAEKLVFEGFDVNQMIHEYSEDTTIFTSLCAFDFTKYNSQLVWLLKNRANPDIPSSKGTLCLHKVLNSLDISTRYKQCNQYLKLLIEAGADVNLPNLQYGKYRPLAEIASTMNLGSVTDDMRNQMLQAVEILLKAGADPNMIEAGTQNFKEVALINFADSYSHFATKAANLLLDNGADPMLLANDSPSSLHYLSLRCKNELCETVMSKIVKKAPSLLNLERAIWHDKQTALCYSVMTDNEITADILLNLKADTSLRCNSGKTPYLTSKPDSKVRKVFEAHGVNQ